MSDALPQLSPEELARRLDGGEAVQVLDIRAPEKVARGRVQLGAALEFRAVPTSKILHLANLEPLALDPGRPVAVICGHGNSSKEATAFLRRRGIDAYSVTGGMAAWEAVYVARRLTPTPALEHVVQIDRVGKGALSYVLASQGEAVVVDPGRHVERYDALLAELDARPVAVIDTHMHADYLSGAAVAAARWGVSYHLHPDDARSPYDHTPGRGEYRSMADGDRIAFGRA
ncbi:MAG TPA: rhodanese-like domain-containing protein, partial [Gemmatimonadales bacterium]|nr:rhodanese-like domain-containing protein [Gemmatimonadales bacterium]